jgi:hypothetical protein
VTRRDDLEIIRAALDGMDRACGDGDGACLFREPGKPRVDFYPSTGRWRTVGREPEKVHRGGARAFIAWYAK